MVHSNDFKGVSMSCVSAASTAHIISGAYDPERDDEGPFQWLAQHVDLEVFRAGLLFFAVESAVEGRAVVAVGSRRFELIVRPGRSELPIPVPDGSFPQLVALDFVMDNGVPGDSRTLTCKARGFRRAAEPRDRETSPAPGPVSALLDGRGVYAGALATSFPEGWLRMSARKTGETLVCSGIVRAPLRRLEPPRIAVNDVMVRGFRYGLLNRDYLPLGYCAFEGEVRLAAYESVAGLRFSSVYSSDGQRATPWYQDWYWPLSSNRQAMPESRNLRRIGASEGDWFLFSGASFVEKISEAIGCRDVSALRILDWGCGCGRLTRHLLERGYGAVVGIDIDAENIAWCREHLPEAQFTLVSPDVPCPLESAQFDCIIGHSVFTHLSEVDQFLWLDELERLLKPGGHALVTIMTNFSTFIEYFAEDDYRNLQERGFLDVGWQNDGVDYQKPGFYRRIFHTVDYILKHWAAVFDICSVLDGFSDHQNAIVLRKRV